ncbi:MAG: lamin tail domain-containing protein, partial [Candidatus Pacebacteria bacterium]|nr:lamin tail domain-containing protein [Candidatus Paceibacterota bacterium]
MIAFFNSNFVFASEIDNLEQNIDNLEQYLTLKNKVSENVIKSIPKIFYENWESYLIASSGKDSDALIVITMLSIQKTIKFLAVDYPLDFAYNIGKEMFSLARIILTTDISGLIGKIEQITVDKAIEYAMNELFKHEIRVGSGIMETDYITNKGTKSNVKINYIITQKQINNESQNKKYETVIRLYSPKTIEVPTNKFWGNFIMVYENQDEIKPFTVTMKGEMEYKNFNYRWMDTPEVIVEYPKVVPDFGFKPVSFWEKYITKPIGETLKSIKKLFNLGGGSIFDSFNSRDLEIIEENEDLEKLAEDIKEIEDELEQENEKIEQTEEEFAEKVAQLNKENELVESELVPDQSPESNENLITLKDDMTEEEVRQLLIAIYNELLKRQTALASQEQENNNDENDEKQEELELEKDKKEKSPKKEISYCAYNNQTSLSNKLIINEVAWMGTNNNSADEWIELKNISSEVIDLEGYQLLDKDNQIQVIFKDLKVSPGDYVLLERTDDNTVPNIKADIIYKGNLNNNKESLYLFNNNCVLEDMVEANPNWPAGDNSNKKSMERKLDLTWQTYSGDSFGTPKASNSEGESVVIPGGGGGGGSNPPKEEITYCAQTNLKSPTRNDVIINEVAWMGTSNSSTDEWIELKNITSKDISLKGYQLLDKENQIKVVFKEEDVVLANSFYLLERTDDDTVLNIKADKIYTGALSDTTESLRLFNSNCELIDEVLADPNWPAGDNSNKKSMERKPDLTWQTYLRDSFGTPRAENSIANAYVPNPASVFCDEKGGKIEIRQNEIGDQYGVCVFDDGKMCEEWAMYSDSCTIGGIDTSYFTNDEDLFCAIKGGMVGDNDCYLPSGKTCDLISFYNGSCYDKTYADSLIITEVSEGHNNDDREYVRLFNQSGKNISLCSSENNCFYLAYFSPKGNDYQPPEWNKPNLNIPLENVLLNNNSYYQIDFTKDNRGNFKPLIDDDHLFMDNGSVCIFNQDVTKLSSEDEAKKAKIDCVGWIHYGNLSYGPEYDINESTAVSRFDAIDRRTEQNRYALLRKKDSLNGLYFDRDNNSYDFEYGKPTIYTLTSVLNFKFTEFEDKTNLQLSWDFSDFLDLSKISYKVIYTKNSDFNSEENIVEMPTKKAVDKHVEEIIPSIEEGIDYRFRVKMFEEGANESDQLDHLFYVYISSFDNHIYGLKRYDYNKTNHTSYLGSQNGVVKKDLISQDNSWLFIKVPLIDKYGNFYFAGGSNSYYNTKIISYDKNGLFRWEIDAWDSSLGDMIFSDTPYYFSKNKLIKFSHIGDILWESDFDEAVGYKNALLYNNHLYFDCILLEK